MIRKLYGVMLLCITPVLLFAQYKNNIWLLGYDNEHPLPWGGSKLVFLSDTILISADNRSMEFNGCFSGLSAQDDSWFVYTNGSAVCNKNNDTLTNGFGLSPGGDDGYRQGGFPIPGSTVIIPANNSSNLLYLFHENILSGVPPIPGQPRALRLYYSVIDPNAGIFGSVLNKNIILIDDTIEVGNLTACRHANGRDWWIIVKSYYSSIYYTILVTPNGPLILNQQNVPGTINIIGGQGNFSADGGYFATFDNDSQLRIYDFDRCTGVLSNYRFKYITPNTGGFISFSPNSRFLYVSKTDTLWQFDMQAPDVLNSQTFIASYDGYTDSLWGFSNRFWYHWPGPDGKIYMSASSSSRVLHVINNPDEPGLACNFQQHSVHFPTYNAFTTPTYVNLNLFQVPGSVCDSLGVGIQDLNSKNDGFKIKPNPNDGHFNIEYIPQRVSGILHIYDIVGKEVYREYVSPFSSIKNLDLNNKLTNGIYAVGLVFGNTTLTQKLMIQKP
jgi:hypothetical protein